MNYIDLINNVWSLREQGIISAHEQDLYMYLLHKSNMLFWKNPFNQPTEVLCSILGFNRNALIARRNRLKQLNLIDFKEGKAKNRPAEYSIVYDLQTYDNLDNDEPTENTEQTKTPKTLQVSRTKTFFPPTLSEVANYCNERRNKVNAQRFIDFYTAKAWMLGKNKMKDWEAAVRTWERNDSTLNHPATNYKPQTIRADERF